MRLLLSFLVLLLALPATAQRGRGPALAGVWIETAGQRAGQPVVPASRSQQTTLILEPDGFFEEIRPASSRNARSYRSGNAHQRRYTGTWDADYRHGGLVMQVDRGRRRPQLIRHTIVYSDRNELVLRSRSSGRERVFIRRR